jgi:hypothetical protein
MTPYEPLANFKMIGEAASACEQRLANALLRTRLINVKRLVIAASFLLPKP